MGILRYSRDTLRLIGCLSTACNAVSRLTFPLPDIQKLHKPGERKRGCSSGESRRRWYERRGLRAAALQPLVTTTNDCMIGGRGVEEDQSIGVIITTDGHYHNRPYDARPTPSSRLLPRPSVLTQVQLCTLPPPVPLIPSPMPNRCPSPSSIGNVDDNCLTPKPSHTLALNNPMSFQAPTLYLLNANSIVKPHAIDLLTAELQGYKADIAVITESHLKEKHTDDVINIEGYTVLRRDRQKRKGGGVALFIRSDYSVSNYAPPNDNRSYELLWTEISTGNSHIFLGALYHPPTPIYSTKDFTKFIDDSVEAILTSHPSSIVIIAGDMNGLDVPDLMTKTGLTDLVKVPTRGPNILDQVLISQPLYDHVKVVRSACKSDHSAIVLYSGETKTAVGKVSRQIEFRQRTPALHAAFFGALSNLDPAYFDLDAASPQEAFDLFYHKSLALLNKFYPARLVTLTSTDPHYLTPEIKLYLRRKNKLMRKGRIEAASALAEKIRTLIIKQNSMHLKHIDQKDGGKALWEQVRLITGKQGKPCPPSSITAFTLNTHYANISTDNDYQPPSLKATANSTQPCHEITEQFVFHILDRLRPTATGLDGLPSWFLRTGAPILAKPIAHLFNLSLHTSFVPSQWKTSSIHPIAKVPQPKTPADYRPISITPVLSRTLERHIVSTYLYPALLDPPPNLTFSDQYAFRPTGSTTAAVVSIIQEVTNLLEVHPFVRVVALDFSKAFDTLRHKPLLDKLAAMSVPDNIYNWIVDFLQHRKHQTKFEGQASSSLDITASVIQGSALGPVAYTIAASDLTAQHPGNSIKKYADDSYLIIPASNINTTELELTNIAQWSNRNNLQLNRSKSVEIIFHKPRSKPNPPPPIPSIQRVESLKILGVTFSSTLSINQHVKEVTTACTQSLHALRVLRTHALSAPLINTVFTSKILSKITYCSPAWRGFASAADLTMLEGFVRRCKRQNFCSKSQTSLEPLLDSRDSQLFKAVTSSNHVLHPLLPPPPTHQYTLRQRTHYYTLPPKRSAISACNYLYRILYKDIY